MASTGEETVGGGGERSGTDYTGGQYCSRQETREGKEAIFLFQRAWLKKELMSIGESKIMTDIGVFYCFICLTKSPLCVNCTLTTSCNIVCL